MSGRARTGHAAKVYPERWAGKHCLCAAVVCALRSFLKRWFSSLVSFTVLGCGAACVFGQGEQPSAAEKKSATTIVAAALAQSSAARRV